MILDSRTKPELELLVIYHQQIVESLLIGWLPLHGLVTDYMGLKRIVSRFPHEGFQSL